MRHWEFFVGMSLFLLAQIIRSVRWQILLPENTQHKKRGLLLYTSIGSLLNTILPLRAGDLIRSFLLSNGVKEIRFSTSLSSVLIERMTDGISIIFMILLINYLNPSISLPFASWMLIVPSIVISFWALVSYSKIFKLIVYKISSLWNSSIQISILDFFWTLNLQIKHKRFISIQYVASTVIMWTFYFSSYYCFSSTFPNLTIIQTFRLFHSDNLNGSLITAFESGYSQDIIFAIAIFLMLPIMAALFYSILSEKKQSHNNSENLLSFFSKNFSYSTLGLPSSFSGKGAYSNFLYSHFSGNQELLSKLGNQGFGDCKISRVFHGGSGAITAVIEKAEGLSIRKVANLSEAKKLREQYLWLSAASKNGLPVTEVFNYTTQNTFCFYEMPFSLGTMDMHEWIHAVPTETSISTLKNILSVISQHHTETLEYPHPPDALNQYLNNKVINNISLVKDILIQLIDPNDFSINGEKFSLKEWNFLSDLEFMKSIFIERGMSDIHGDLTIDNLIVKDKSSWTLIDPNPSTSYKSALMDWAKLLQSLHTGYEFLDRDTEVVFEQSSIRYMSYKSDKYQELYLFLLSELNSRFGPSGIKEAYLHEIIHYLRLLPYKFQSNDEKGLLFFSVTCLIIREFKERYAIA